MEEHCEFGGMGIHAGAFSESDPVAAFCVFSGHGWRDQDAWVLPGDADVHSGEPFQGTKRQGGGYWLVQERAIRHLYVSSILGFQSQGNTRSSNALACPGSGQLWGLLG